MFLIVSDLFVILVTLVLYLFLFFIHSISYSSINILFGYSCFLKLIILNRSSSLIVIVVIMFYDLKEKALTKFQFLFDPFSPNFWLTFASNTPYSNYCMKHFWKEEAWSWFDPSWLSLEPKLMVNLKRFIFHSELSQLVPGFILL